MADQVDWKFAAQITVWVVTAIAAVILAPLKWIVQRAIAQIGVHATRLDTLERTTVTRQDFADTIAQIRRESKEDRAALHVENVGHLERIECKIDGNEERNEALRTVVYEMSAQVAVLADRSDRKSS